MFYLRLWTLLLAAMLIVALAFSIVANLDETSSFFISVREKHESRERAKKFTEKTIQEVTERFKDKPFRDWPENARMVYRACRKKLAEYGENYPEEPEYKSEGR